MSPKPAKAPEHFVVFVPGYMGSKLKSKSTGKMVWMDVPGLLRNPLKIKDAIEEMFTAMRYPNDDIEPAGIMDRVVFVPPLFKQEQYGRMFEALEKFGYEIDPQTPDPNRLAAYSFSYDWRQDNRLSAQQLGQHVAELRQKHNGAQAWLIGHSNGGIVSRWYIEKEGGKEHVGRLFLMGSPWDGAPKSMLVMQRGLEMMFTRLFNRFGVAEMTRDLVRTFPSYYQLIPVFDPFLRDADNRDIDPFADTRWLDTEEQRKMLLDARKFNSDLGTTLSVETLCFFGVKMPTTTAGRVTVDASGRWSDVDWDRTSAGDGTVPERSAVHPNAKEKLPYSVGHGDIYINPAVLEKLEWEMVHKYRAGVLARVVTERFIIQFEPVKDAYDPGEKIEMWARVNDRKSRTPIVNAEISVEVEFAQGLFSDTEVIDADLPFTELRRSAKSPGLYTGSVSAPLAPAYYRLHATVQVPGEKAVVLDELVLVEPQDDGAQDKLLKKLTKEAAREKKKSRKKSKMSDTEESALPEIEMPKPGLPTDEFLLKEAGPPLTGGDTLGDGGFIEPLAGGIFNESTGAGGAGLAFDIPMGGDEPAIAEEIPAGSRQINAWLEDYDGNKPETLQVGDEYSLIFSVDMQKVEGGAAIPLKVDRLFQPGESMAELAVQLSSKDFNILTRDPQRLRVPLEGRSRNKARFDIEPRHAGKGEITAMFFKNNNFVQGMTLTIYVGKIPADKQLLMAAEPLGRALDDSFALQPRDVCLFIQEDGNEFKCTMVGAVAAQAILPLKDEALVNRIARLRETLLNIVDKDVDGTYVYQEGLEIPEAANQESLVKLAEAGWDLFDAMFGALAGADAQLMGEKLLELARKNTLKLQIVSKEFLLPWGALYLSDGFDPDDVKVENFLGMCHIIEQIPFQATMPVLDAEIQSRPRLSVSLNLNAAIDEQFPEWRLIGKQRDFWKKFDRKQITLVERTSSSDLVKALKDPATSDQILYFYGHAVAQLANTGESQLLFSDEDAITKDQLNRLTSKNKQPLAGAPLVFINACESAQLSPKFYDGFMPFFVAKGARGMIGTEAQVPALFAEAWAERFFEEFLCSEKTLGEVFLELRKEFYREHNNILGLMYSVYCDADTQVQPGLTI